ncbi:hypothetical protein ANCCAN_25131 [Ancylostoma caninum]|uniref:Uncharacterized protein n=1 Tax=Ancylostoma caninum TaxID=29170 RepID=A0A368FAH5_ANCCA|nr:hypothetical protein ANCCAN_25131 [Ancylostoma caninum]
MSVTLNTLSGCIGKCMAKGSILHISLLASCVS